MRTTRVLTGASVMALIVFASTAAGAWPVPGVQSSGGGCSGSGRRGPITWTVRNLENTFPRSPGHIEDVVVTPAFPTTMFNPISLPNSGSATATATTEVPPNYSGTVHLVFKMVWAGFDGGDQKDGSASATVSPCPVSQPPSTTPRSVPVTPSTTTTTLVPGGAPTTTTTTTTVVPGEATTTTTISVAGAQVEAPVAVPVKVAVSPAFTG